MDSWKTTEGRLDLEGMFVVPAPLTFSLQPFFLRLQEFSVASRVHHTSSQQKGVNIKDL